MKKLFIILLILSVCGSAYAADTGWKSPGTMADDNTVGTQSWQDVDNAKTSNDSDAYCRPDNFPENGNYLKATNFGFSIPSEATIDGIIVEIERATFVEGSNKTQDNEVKIVESDGTIGSENKADTGVDWPESDAYKSYGGSSDKWSETWSDTDINDSDFGVVLSPYFPMEDLYAYVDHIRIKVYYTEEAGAQGQIIRINIQ